MQWLTSYITALVTTLFCIILLRPLAITIGLVDHPGGRKQHKAPTPLIGGIALFFGFCFALLTVDISLIHYRGLVAGSALLIFVGVLDDFNDISSKFRLCIQIIAALLMTLWGHVSLVNLGDLFFLGTIKIGLLGILLTIIAVVAYINSLNMLDGQDGLAGIIALLQLLLLAYIAWHLKEFNAMHILTITLTSVLVFLIFNVRMPWQGFAKIFMGDAGSTFLAYLIAWFGIQLSQSNLKTMHPMVIMWVLSYPIFDFSHVCYLRLKHKKSPLKSGREHMHHLLLNTGLSSTSSTLILCLSSFALGILGLLMNSIGLSEGWMLIIWLLTLTCYIFLTQRFLNQHVEI